MSARVILALTVAALVLAGCGGGSSDPEVSGTTAAAADEDAGPSGSSTTAEATRGIPKSREDPKATAAPSEASGDEVREGQGGGQRIAQPKGAREQAPTPAEIANATVADMTLESPAIVASAGNPGSLSPAYTCDGRNSWPVLSWQGVPAGTAELALYLMNVQPVDGLLFVDWAVSGLDPGLDGLEAGKLPKGAVVGQNSLGEQGYSLCPAGRGEIYMFAIYALPEKLALRPGFDAREARARILGISGNAGLLPALYAHS